MPPGTPEVLQEIHQTRATTTTKTAVTVSAANYTQIHAEPHSEQNNVTVKVAGSSTSEEQKAHSNATPRVGGEKERKK